MVRKANTFIGRDVELSILSQAFDKAALGDGQAVFIHGVLCVGKTSLLENFLESIEDKDCYILRFLVGHYPVCSSYKIITQNEDFFGSLDNYLSQRPEETGYNIDKFLRQKSEEKIIVLAVDNGSFVDAESRSVIKTLIASLGKNPYKILMIFTSTPTTDVFFNYKYLSEPLISNLEEFFCSADENPKNSVTINLSGIKLADILWLINQKFPKNNFENDLANRIQRFSMGNPFVINEVFNYLIQSGVVYQEDGVYKIVSYLFLDNVSLLLLENVRITDLLAKIDTYDNSKEIFDVFFYGGIDVVKQLCENYCNHIIFDTDLEKKLIELCDKIEAFLLDKSFEKKDEVLCNVHKIKELYNNKNELLKPEKIENYDFYLLKSLSNEDLKRVFGVLEYCLQEYRMKELDDLSDHVYNSLDEIFPNQEDGYGEALYEVYRLKNAAFDRLSYFKKALDFALLMIKTAEKFKLGNEKKSKAYSRKGLEELALSDFKGSIESFSTAVEYAEKTGDELLISISNNYLGMPYTYLNELNRAMVLFKYAEKTAIKLNNKLALAKARLNIGVLDFQRKLYDDAESNLVYTEVTFLEEKCYAEYAQYFCYMGLVYAETNSPELANLYIRKALQLGIQYSDMALVGICYYYLGVLQAINGFDDEALDFYYRALNIISCFDKLRLEASISISIAEILGKQGKYQQAEQYFLKAGGIYSGLGFQAGLIDVFMDLGDLCFVKEDLENAEKYYLKCDENFMRVDEKIDYYHILANLYCCQQNFAKGMEFFNNALTLARENALNKEQAEILNDMGNMYLVLENNDFALRCYTLALDINEQLYDTASQSLNYVNLGTVYERKKDFLKAADCYRKATECDRKKNDMSSLAANLEILAHAYTQVQNYSEAVKYFLEASETYKKSGNYNGAAQALCKASDVLRLNSEFQRAERVLQEAQEICQTSGYIEGLGLCSFYLACVQKDSENYKEALKNFKKAVEYFLKSNPTNKFRYLSLDFIALIYEYTGRKEEALLNHLQLADIFKEEGDFESLAQKYTDIADFMSNPENGEALGDNFSAKKYYTLALETAEQVSDVYLKAKCYYSAGEFHNYLGENQKGIELILKAAKIIEDAHKNDVEAAKYYLMASDAFYDIKDYDSAVHNYLSAADIYIENGDIQQTAYVYNNIGYTYDTMSRFREAIKFYHQAYENYKKINYTDGIINNLKNVALMYERLEQYPEAASYYRKVLDGLKDFDSEYEKGDTALDIAQNSLKAGFDYREVAKYTDMAYTFFKNADDEIQPIICLENLALLYYSNGEDKKALGFLKKLLKELKVSSGEVKIQIYKSLASIYFRLSEYGKMFEMISKAIALAGENTDNWEAMGEVYYDFAVLLLSDDLKYADNVSEVFPDKTFAKIAVEYLENAEKIAKAEKDDAAFMKAADLKAVAKSSFAKMDEVVADYKELLDFEKENDTQKYVVSLLAQGEIMLNKFQNFEIAERCFDEAYKMAKEIKSPDLAVLSRGYTCLKYFMQGMPGMAKMILDKEKDYFDLIVTTVPAIKKYL